MVEDAVCRFSAAVEVAKRTHAANHRSEKPQANKPFWSDGMLLWPRLLSDDEYEKYSGTRRA